MNNNWIEKYEDKQEEKREKELNNKLDKLLQQLDETYVDNDRKKILQEILLITDSMIKEYFDYDKQLELSIKEELEEIRLNEMNKNHNNEKEAASWEEFKKEENDLDERD